MNTTEKPPFDSPSRGRSGDDLDGLLRAFFRAEMPHPWPTCPEPPAATLTLPSHLGRPGWTLARSRVALAASVVLLLAGLWALGGKFPGIGPDDKLGPPTGIREKPFVPVAPAPPVDDIPDDVDLKEMLILQPDGTAYKVYCRPQAA